MSDYEINIPSISGDPTSVALKVGEIMYVLGANGAGKSSLISWLYSRFNSNSKRISAHRQTWFDADTIDMTPRDREQRGAAVQSQESQPAARYREWDPSARATIAVYDLISAYTTRALKITKLLEDDRDGCAKEESKSPAEIDIMNELMRLSNLAIEIGLGEGQKLVARKNGGDTFSVSQLSDGERNAFLVAADVLTAKPGTLILVDEPERHLHRSIISPLLKLLFERRRDCVFIVSTHDVELPLDTPRASTLLLRDIEYEQSGKWAWTADHLPPHSTIDDDLRRTGATGGLSTSAQAAEETQRHTLTFGRVGAFELSAS